MFRDIHSTIYLLKSCSVKEFNQSHLLYFEAIIGNNQLITCIPDYEDIFKDKNIEEQILSGKYHDY